MPPKWVDFVSLVGFVTYYAASMEVEFVVTSMHKFAMIEMKRLDFGRGGNE